MFKLTPLMVPGQVRGFASAQDERSLSPVAGTMAALGSVRLGDGVVRARWGDAVIKSGLTSAFRGAFECTLNGTSYLFRAYATGGRVAIEASTDGGANWAEVTTTAGAFGNTRLTDPATPVPIRFCVVKDRAPLSFESYDCLIIQNGIDSPRLYAKAVTGSTAFAPGVYGMAIISQPIAPKYPLRTAQTLNTRFSMDSAGTTFSASSAHLTGADSAAGTTNNDIKLSLTAAYVAGDTATCVFATPIDFTGITAFIIATSTGTDGFWDGMQIEVGDGAAHWDILSTSGSANLAGPDTTLTYTQFLLQSPGTPTVTYSAVDRLRFTWLGAAPAGTVTGDLLLFAGQGDLPAATLFAVTYFGTDFRGEGPPALSPVVLGATVGNSGGPANLASVALSSSPEFLYNFFLSAVNTDITHRNLGVDRWFIYRQDVGVSNFYLVGSRRMASWAPSAWSFDSSGPDVYVATIGTSASTSMGAPVNYARPLRSSDTVVIPTGTAMAAANARLFVAAGSRIWFSDYELPFSFRMAVSFLSSTVSDPASGGSFTLDGQTVQALVPLGAFAGAAEDLSSPIAGTASLFVLSDRNLMQLSGFDSRSLSHPIQAAPYGTLSPLSVGRSKLGFFWLDDRGQVCEFSSQGFGRISVSVVDDKTTAVPAARKVWAVGACANDRYYLGYSSAGQTVNDSCLVYYEVHRNWESIDSCTVGSFEAILPYYSGGYVKLLRFGTTTVYEHEQPSLATNVPISVTFPSIHREGQRRIDSGAMTVWCDGATFSLSTIRTTEAGPATAGTISVTGAAPVVQMDQGGIGAGGIFVTPGLSGTVPGGTKFYSAFLNIEDSASPASR